MRSLVAASLLLLAAACTAPNGSAGDDPTPPGTAAATTPVSPQVVTTPTPSPTQDREVSLGLETVAEDLDQPLVATAPDGDDRLFVAERPGTIRVIEDGTVAAEPFLDISDRVRTGGEYGLLGVAFHPGYPEDARFFVHYSAAADGATTVAEYEVSDDPDRADPGSERVLLSIRQPASNHNGGTVAFGPDGALFIGLGDGGGGGDTYSNGQDPSTLLGTILRIDVDDRDGDTPYTVPPDNPFADGEQGAPEVWAYGLRNPYRLSFDEGLLYIADVGQDAREEVNVVAADEAGLNFGWPITEGSACFRSAGCDRSGLTDPVLEYTHDEPAVCGVIGGHVHRGSNDAFAGTYVYGDLCASWVRSFRYVDGQVTEQGDHSEELGLGGGSGGYQLLSFGRDAAGELYVLTASAVHRIVVE